MILAVLLMTILMPVLAYGQEAPEEAVDLVAAIAEDKGVGVLDAIPGDGLGQIVSLVIALMFAWLAKKTVGKEWLKALLDGLEVGVNNAWEEYVKEKKQGGKKLKEDEKQKARELALDRAKSVMGVGAKILLATTPQAKVVALISGLVNRRKREAAGMKK